MIEKIFEAFQSRGKANRRETANESENKIKRDSVDEIVVESADVKHRFIAEQSKANGDSQRVGEH